MEQPKVKPKGKVYILWRRSGDPGFVNLEKHTNYYQNVMLFFTTG
jgi:hypothetical protein